MAPDSPLAGSPDPVAARAELALRLAREAGELLLDGFRSGLSGGFGTRVAAERKARGIVTSLDRQAEAVIATGVAGAFPGDGLLSEEGVDRGSSTGWHWIADPLDGTTNLVAGLPMWAVSLAALDPAGTAVGVVHAPALGWTFAAERGQGPAREGARGEGVPLGATSTTDLADAVFLVNKAYGPPDRLWALTRDLLPALRAFRMLGCVSLDLALVAAGRADGVVLLPADAWDVAAGLLLVAESGGLASDLEGRPLPASGRSGVLAAAPGVHAAALARLRP